MMRRLAVRSFHVATAAALLRAGVALACPTPPPGGLPGTCTLTPPAEQDCAPSGALDLDLAFPKGLKNGSAWEVTLKATRDYGWGGTNVCDAMILFQAKDDAASSDVTATLQGSPSTALRNVRVTNVQRTSTTPSGSTANLARYGSGAFCLWTSEDNRSYDQSYQVTVEAFDPQGNVHKGVASVKTVCKTSPSAWTSQTVYYQKTTNGSNLDSTAAAAFCSAMNTECMADATLPPTCGLENGNVCACTDITTPPPTPPEPASPGNVCIEVGERVYCGPVAPTVPGTPPGEVCINHGDTVVCGPVSVCVTSGESVVCGPATGPGTNPGDVCISREGTVCGPVGGSGYGPGNDGGDVCISREGTVCGGVTTDTGCSGNREGTTCPGSAPGDVCVHGAETATVCGQVPVAASSDATGSTASSSSSATAAGGASPKSGCAAFPGADVGGAGLLALLCLGALRRRR